MTLTHTNTLKLIDAGDTNNLLTIIDEAENITVGIDVRGTNTRVSVAVELDFHDLVQLRDRLDSLVRRRISARAARAVPID